MNVVNRLEFLWTAAGGKILGFVFLNIDLGVLFIEDVGYEEPPFCAVFRVGHV